VLSVGGIFKDQIGEERADDVRSLQRIFSVIALDIYSHEMKRNSSRTFECPVVRKFGKFNAIARFCEYCPDRFARVMVLRDESP
jgi:hypothetical protein